MPNTSIQGTAKKYFEDFDNGKPLDALFAPDFEFYFPKFGVGRGLEEFYECGAGLMGSMQEMAHYRDLFKYHVNGLTVIVEGTSHGTDKEGRTWDGGKTPGGRFCNVFDFTGDGRIRRLFIYLDPDYTSQDQDRFRWKRTKPRW
jgi:SnoaL-like domain